MKRKLFAAYADELTISTSRKVVHLAEAKLDVVCALHEGNYLVYNRRCPHMGRLMDNALIVNEVIICPAHQYIFSALNGGCINHPSCPTLTTYETSLEDGKIFILIDEKSIEYTNHVL